MISQIIIITALASLAAASGDDPISYAPQPYQFGYEIGDVHSQQYRHEASDGAGRVVGSYGFIDANGIKRQVDYVADHNGFRAKIRTNEPGTANQDPAAVEMISDAPYDADLALGYEGVDDDRLGVAGPVEPSGLEAVDLGYNRYGDRIGVL